MNNTTPNTLTPELKAQIEKDAIAITAKFKDNNDYQAGYRQGFEDGYESGGDRYALKWQQAEEMMEKMAEYLERIKSPIAYLQKEADKEGAILDGQYAWQIANDANWLRGQAMGAIADYQTYKQTKDGTANG